RGAAASDGTRRGALVAARIDGRRGARYDRSMFALVSVALSLGLVDLTQALAPESPAWPGAAHVSVGVDVDYAHGYFARHFAAPEHAGTHVDAPAHFVRGAATVDAIA